MMSYQQQPRGGAGGGYGGNFGGNRGPVGGGYRGGGGAPGGGYRGNGGGDRFGNNRNAGRGGARTGRRPRPPPRPYVDKEGNTFRGFSHNRGRFTRYVDQEKLKKMKAAMQKDIIMEVPSFIDEQSQQQGHQQIGVASMNSGGGMAAPTPTAPPTMPVFAQEVAGAEVPNLAGGQQQQNGVAPMNADGGIGMAVPPPTAPTMPVVEQEVAGAKTVGEDKLNIGAALKAALTDNNDSEVLKKPESMVDMGIIFKHLAHAFEEMGQQFMAKGKK